MSDDVDDEELNLTEAALRRGSTVTTSPYAEFFDPRVVSAALAARVAAKRAGKPVRVERRAFNAGAARASNEAAVRRAVEVLERNINDNQPVSFLIALVFESPTHCATPPELVTFIDNMRRGEAYVKSGSGTDAALQRVSLSEPRTVDFFILRLAFVTPEGEVGEYDNVWVLKIEVL
jgi:hypothetical protein